MNFVEETARKMMEATETKFKEDVNNFRAVEEPVEGEDGELRAAAKQVGA